MYRARARAHARPTHADQHKQCLATAPKLATSPPSLLPPANFADTNYMATSFAAHPFDPALADTRHNWHKASVLFYSPSQSAAAAAAVVGRRYTLDSTSQRSAGNFAIIFTMTLVVFCALFAALVYAKRTGRLDLGLGGGGGRGSGSSSGTRGRLAADGSNRQNASSQDNNNNGGESGDNTDNAAGDNATRAANSPIRNQLE